MPNISFILFVILFFTCSVPAWSQSSRGNGGGKGGGTTVIGNGGAGIKIDGKVATFYTVEMDVKPTEITPSTLAPLTDFIDKLLIPAEAKFELSESLMPSHERKYYTAKRESITQDVLEKIKKEYSLATGFSQENIIIFALTDPESKITLLLPDFFKLSNTEQMAIIFHESLWINKRVKSYKDMVSIETNVQMVLSYPKDCLAKYALVRDLEYAFEEKTWSVNAAYTCENEKYNYFSKGTPPTLNFLFPHQSLRTLAKLMLSSLYGNEVYNLDELKVEFQSVLKTGIISNEDSKIFSIFKNAFLRSIEQDRVSFDVNAHPFLHEALIQAKIDTVNKFSERNIEIMAQLLKQASVEYDYFYINYEQFKLKIRNIGTIEINKLD